MNVNNIATKLEKLPEHLIPEVIDYIEFLSKKYSDDSSVKTVGNKFEFDWEGGLIKLKNQYTAVELQHMSLDWR